LEAPCTPRALPRPGRSVFCPHHNRIAAFRARRNREKGSTVPGSRFDDFTRSMATSRRGFLATLLAGATAGLAHLLSATGQTDDPLTEREAARATEQAQRDSDQATLQAESAAEQETHTAQ
jgi:hypothetical protein